LKTISYDYFYNTNHDPALLSWLESLTDVFKKQSDPSRHGHFPGWLNALHSLPTSESTTRQLNTDVIKTSSRNCPAEQQRQIKDALMQLCPWRKGPFQIEDIFVDSEWKSNLKWNRIAKHISSLKDRTVLDVGCGNGYYGYRMLGEGAKTVVGVDPGELFCTQFAAINHFMKADA